jgi:hypothetical protein
MAIEKAPKKSAAKKTTTKKATAKKTTTKKATAKKTAAKKTAPMRARRADYGQPIDAFFSKQPPALQPIHAALRSLIERAAPDAVSALKWGMPFYEIGGNLVCGIGGHKKHVNLILFGAPETYPDPEGLLEGEGKTGRHLKLTSLDDLPEKAVRGWLAIAARRARRGERA